VRGLVTLTTDFGQRDPWVAQVRGVLASVWSRYPDFVGSAVDLGHDLPPHDVAAAAWFFCRASATWPAGTVHLAVVDPGVGTLRPAVACASAGSFYVGPGNGLLEFLTARDDLRVVILDRPLYQGHPLTGEISTTFHGRDVFAPAAAHLAAGVPLEQVGRPAGRDDLGRMPAEARSEAPCIVWIDRFGNAISDLDQDSADGRRAQATGRISLEGKVISGPVLTYGESAGETPFWYWGSGGTLEIGVRSRSAAELLGLRRGLVLEVPKS